MSINSISKDNCNGLDEDECSAPDCIYEAGTCRIPICGDEPYIQYCVYCTIESQCTSQDDGCEWDDDNQECYSFLTSTETPDLSTSNPTPNPTEYPTTS